MPDEKQTLALSFIHEEPELAAKILEKSDIAELAGFLQSIPSDYQNILLRNMLPFYSSKVCIYLGADEAAGLLADLEVTALAKILRNLPKNDKARILDKYSANIKNACNLLLRFSSQSIGAWMRPVFASITSDMTVAEVLSHLKKTPEEVYADFVYIIDRNGKLAGRITSLDLLKANKKFLALDIAEKNTPLISANMLLEQVAELSIWEKSDVVSVIDMNEQFLGVLKHADLRIGLKEVNKAPSEQADSSDLVSGILEVYGKTLLVLFSTVMNVIE
tara:strand:- start:864 stop:1691 length:828 start_codon:yes stop_codon:yes gene_type:complete